MGGPLFQKSTRFAVDTNFVLDCFLQDDECKTAWECIRDRCVHPVFLLTPTIAQEFAHKLKTADKEVRKIICGAIESAVPDFGFKPIPMSALNRGIVDQIGWGLRSRGLIPEEEKNDASLMAEACLLDCPVVITNDGHLVGEHRSQITEYLNPFGTPSVAMRPSEILARYGIKVRPGGETRRR